ncbi:VCBS repeat-containing protein [Candidatus Desantisbacteria bacterium]|nr:VCBS repeat-containing protein [Candidatus Desantisbacteria bacterium]
MKRILGFVGILIMGWVSFAFGGTVTVSGTTTVFATIQAGVDVCPEGGMVLVNDGTYTENINFLGKTITVESVHGTTSTIIDGNASGSVVIFNSGEGTGSVLSGFTIRNGKAIYGYGGGIYCDTSSPTITNCTIIGNSTSWGGGGIYCSGTSSPTITNCTISKNSATNGGGIYYKSSSPTITSCTISENSAGGDGGGISCWGTSTLTNCTISKNSAGYHGGGICCYSSSLTLTNCTISKNSASKDYNSDEYGGGGIYCSGTSSLTLTNCTISKNSAPYGGGILCYSSSPPIIINSILWDNSLQEIYTYGGLIIAYSDIKGGWVGTSNAGAGNIVADPLFVGDDDYHLIGNSPCRDKGTNTAPNIPSTDKDGNPRISNSIVDMGAYEYQGNPPTTSSWIDATTGILIDFPSLDDGTKLNIPIGFDFQFYGERFNKINVCTNGFMGFITTGLDSNYKNPFPTGTYTDYNWSPMVDIVAPLWTDWSLSSDSHGQPGIGVAYYLQGGISPNRYFVVEFHNISHFDGGTSQDMLSTFEAVLHESGKIQFNYKHVGYTGEDVIVGLNNGDGILGTTTLWRESPGSNTSIEYSYLTSRAEPISPYINTYAPISVPFQSFANKLASIGLYYKYSSDNMTWGTYSLSETKNITGTSAAGSFSFNCPEGQGYYQFYTLARDGSNTLEYAPKLSDTSCCFWNTPILSVSGTSTVPPSTQRGANDVIIGSLTLSTGVGTITVDSIKLQRSGSCTDADISLVSLYRNDIRIGTGSFINGYVVFTGLNIELAPNTSNNISVKYNISTSATLGNTIGMTLLEPASVGIIGPGTVSSINFPITSKPSLVSCFSLAQELTGVSVSSGIWGDYDADGDMDILICGASVSGNICQVFRNDQGTFSLAANLSGISHYESANGSSWGDYDNDGDLDIAVTGLGSSVIYRNTGGNFESINATLPGLYGSSIAWGDYDNDGDLDIALAGNSSGRIAGIYQNNNGVFTDINANLTGISHGALSWIDYNNDGRLDLSINGDGNEFAKVYTNKGNNTFEDSGITLPNVYVGCLTWADYDNDGDMDVAITGGDNSGNKLSKIYRNDNGTFTDINAGLQDVWVSFASWGDYDNDGLADLALIGKTSGMGDICNIYRNNGNDSFTLDTAINLPGVVNGAINWGDYDHDGDLDILLTGASNEGSIARIYRNDEAVYKPNNLPAPPDNGFSTSLDPGIVTLNWGNGSDIETGASGLYYNLRVGTGSGTGNIVSSLYDSPLFGRYYGLKGKTMKLKVVPDTTYYWAVQSIDAGLSAGTWSTQQSVYISEGSVAENLPPTITITHPTIPGAEADSSYLIGWIDKDIDSPATISLYYDDNNSGTDGIKIVENISEDDANDTYAWDTSEIVDGSYYIYALITDGSSTACSYSTGKVTIDHRQLDSKRLAWHTGGCWLNGDIHMHTKKSDGSNSASDVARKAESYGVDFIAITDHGDSEFNIGSQEYHQAILDARGTVSDLMIFEGVEWNVPGADDGGHAGVIVTNSPDENKIIREFVLNFDADDDNVRGDNDLALAGLAWLGTHTQNNVIPICSLNHPSRASYNLSNLTVDWNKGYTLEKLRLYDDVPGDVCIGFAGDWGHKKYTGEGFPLYFAAMNGFHDPKTAWIGNSLDQLLSEGRKWLIRFEDDFHSTSMDYWPGEYSKTYYYCPSKTYEGVLKGIRGGCSYAVHGNIITGLGFTASCGTQTAIMGETIDACQGQTITLTIRVQKGSGTLNAIELISNITGTAASTHVFTSNDWLQDGDWLQMGYDFLVPNHDFYLRLRGSATSGAVTPWFYTNPIMGKVMPVLIRVIPASGTVGSPITVSGSGFKPNEYIWVGFGTAYCVKKTMSDAFGSFSASFLTQVQFAGETTVIAYGLSSSIFTTTKFTLQPFASIPQPINDMEAFNPTGSSVSLRWSPYLEQTDTQREIDARRNLNGLKAAITLYYKENGRWPESLDSQSHGSYPAFIPKYVNNIPYATLGRQIPNSRRSNVLVVNTASNEDIPANMITNAGGWIYSPNSGDIRINSNYNDIEAIWHTDNANKYPHPGRKYYQYCHDEDDGFSYYRYYDIRYSSSPITESNWGSLPECPGVRITPYKQPFYPYSEEYWDGFLAWDMASNTTYYLACKIQDQTGQWSDISNIAGITTAADDARIADLTVSTITSTSVSMKWTSPTLINYINQTNDIRTIYNIDMLLSAISKYYYDTNGYWPKTLDTTTYTTLPPFIPNYAASIPEAVLRLDNPHADSNNVLIVHTYEDEEIMPSKLTDAGGWIYSPNSGDMRINCTHLDTVMFGYDEYYQLDSFTWPYYQYRHEADKGYRWEGLHGEINCGMCIVGCKGGTPVVALPKYIVKYATFTITEENWNQATTYTVASEPKLGGKSEQAGITGLQPDTNYYFAIKTMDWARDISEISNVVNLYGLQGDPLVITIATQTTLGTTTSPPVPGAEITYIITYENIGGQEIKSLSITDKPELSSAEYGTGSLRMGTVGSTYETADIKSDAQDDDNAGWDGVNGIVMFDVGNIPTGVPEKKGRVYFRVRIR